VKPRAWLSWSSGKDSAWTLAEARKAGEVEIVALLTTVNADYERVAMHGVRESLLEAQAASAGLPLVKVPIPAKCSDEIYQQRMSTALAAATADGIQTMVFGDLFLEDLRAWREAKLAEIGMRAVFPLWKRDTSRLAREMIDGGLRARISCLDPRKLPRALAGREFDRALLDELPASCDPCGENGEFHTFAIAGPMFRAPLDVTVGEVVEREEFVFADLRDGGSR
jgi:uncharacterized protein (TIGR00290 family)